MPLSRGNYASVKKLKTGFTTNVNLSIGLKLDFGFRSYFGFGAKFRTRINMKLKVIPMCMI